MTEQIAMFIPITKVNAQRREVWGWAAIEEPDNSDEILDYESSKPHFLDWSNRAQKRSGGKSLGNVRSMHQNVAAGKLIELRPDDVSKGFYVGAKIIDDNEWKKVEQGVYTGFSVGGSYLKRWNDFRNPGKMRYTAKPTELSIVDSPCIPSATFEMLKMDGSKALRKFKPTQGENMIKVVTSDRFIKVEWDESKHPRAKDGKFGSGGGGGGDINRRELPPDKPGELGGIRTRIKNTEGMFPNEADPKQSIDDEEDSPLPAGYEGAARNPTSPTNPTPKEKYTFSRQPKGESEESKQAPAGGGENIPPAESFIVREKPQHSTLNDPQYDYKNFHPEDEYTEDELKQKYPGEDVSPEAFQARRRGKITKGDVMNRLERIYAILDDVEEELKKADVPEAPETIADIPLKGDYGSYEVEQMPAPNVLMELEANSEPSQEILASHTVKSEDLTDAFEAWLPKVGKMVKSIVAEALADAGVDLKKNSAPARKIRVVTDKPNEEEYHG